MKTKKRTRCYTDASKLCWIMDEELDGRYRDQIGMSRASMVGFFGDEQVVFFEVSHRKQRSLRPTVFNYCPYCGTHYYTAQHKDSGLAAPKRIIDRDL